MQLANANKLYIRELYKKMSSEPTHVVQSTEIATACVCPFLFKLSYPFGVVGGERDYLIANTVHDRVLRRQQQFLITGNMELRISKQ